MIIEANNTLIDVMARLSRVGDNKHAAIRSDMGYAPYPPTTPFKTPNRSRHSEFCILTIKLTNR